MRQRLRIPTWLPILLLAAVLLAVAITTRVVAPSARPASPAPATRALQLDGMGLTDQELLRYDLRRYGVINVSRNPTISDRSLKAIPLDLLDSLDASFTSATDRLADHWGPAPHLERLHLSRTAVGDRVLRAVLPLRSLRTLILDGTRFTGAGLTASDFPRLEEAYLGDLGGVDGPLLASLLCSGRLRRLSLAGSAVNWADVLAVECAPSLDFVNLSRTDAPDEVVGKFLSMATVVDVLIEDAVGTDRSTQRWRCPNRRLTISVAGSAYAQADLDRFQADPPAVTIVRDRRGPVGVDGRPKRRDPRSGRLE